MPGIKFPQDPPAASSGEESEDVTMDEEEEEEEEVENDNEEEEEEDPEEDEEEDDEEGEEESETEVWEDKDVVEEEEKVDVVNRLCEADQDEFMRKYPYLTESLRNANHFLKWDDLGRLGALYIPNWKAKEFEDKWKKLKLEEQELAAKKRELKNLLQKTVLDALKEGGGN